MATAAIMPPRADTDDRFFFGLAVAMAATIFGAFTLQYLIGRSSFTAP
jgi:hypothetical protein